MRFCFSFVLLLMGSLSLSHAQTADLDIATWNVEWFGHSSNGPSDDAKQIERVAQIIATSGIEVWAFQEIDDLTDMDVVKNRLAELGFNFEGFATTISNRSQFVVAYNADVVSHTSGGQMPGDSNVEYAFAGRMPAEVDLEYSVDGGEEVFQLKTLVLHMKAFGDAASYQRRADASVALKTYIDTNYPDDPVVVLGDFNDRLDQSTASGYPSPFVNFLSDTDNYSFLTADMAALALPTWCSNADCTSGSAIDHILVTDELFDMTQPAYRLESVLQMYPDFVDTVSDHLPIVTRISFGAATHVEAVPSWEELTYYPIPARSLVTISGEVQHVEVLDLLGRTIKTIEMNGSGPQFDVSDLITGIYLLKFDGRPGGLLPVSR